MPGGKSQEMYTHVLFNIDLFLYLYLHIHLCTHILFRFNVHLLFCTFINRCECRCE